MFGQRLDTLDYKEMDNRAAKAIEKMGVDIDQKMVISSMPVGHKQFTEIARELSKEDLKLLILDEPLSGLDPINADQFKGIIREEIAAGKNLKMSSHQMATVEEICTDLTILDRSKTVLQGHLNDIKRS